MPLIVCTVCGQDASDRAEACPQCGRPIAVRGPGLAWTFELAAVIGLFGMGSLGYSLLFPEDLVVNEARVKFWFGFQLLAMAFAFLALGWWKRTHAEKG